MGCNLRGLAVLFFLVSQTVHASVGTLAVGLLAASTVGITDRQENNDYAEKLDIDKRATVLLTNDKGICTSTFISPVVLLTAAHCIDPKHPTGGVTVEGVDSIAYLVNSKYIYTDGEEATPSANDVALVFFPPGTGEFLGIARYPSISTGGVDIKEKVYLIGYGIGNFYGMVIKGSADPLVGVRGWGTADLQSVENGIIRTTNRFIPAPTQMGTEPPEEKGNSRALPGDSGGAVYDQRGDIIAVVSEVSSKILSKTVGRYLKYTVKQVTGWNVANYFTEITTEDNSSLINTALEAGNSPNPVKFLAERKLISEQVMQALAKLTPVSKNIFASLTLRTGSYVSEKASAVYLVPFYEKGELTRVLLREKKDGKLSGATLFRCESSVCMNRAGTDTIIAIKERFARGTFDKRSGPEEKPKLLSNAEYRWVD